MALSAPPGSGRRDVIGVVDVQETSPTRGQLVGQVELSTGEHEVQHLGWHVGRVERTPSEYFPDQRERYLIAPGNRSSVVHIIDTLPEPRAPRLIKTIGRESVSTQTGYVAPFVARSRPDGILVSALEDANSELPGGIFVLDPLTFELRGRWEENGQPASAYDFLWNSRHRVLITSEWGPPSTVREGFEPRRLASGGYGHLLRVWDLDARRQVQVIDLGAAHQMAGAVRPAHNPSRAYGFATSAVSRADFSGAVFLWYLDYRNGEGPTGQWRARKVIEIPAEPSNGAALPDVLRGSGTVPPLVTNLTLSRDDRMLYVTAWASGTLLQYDVSDPFNPVLASTVHLGGIARHAPHPAQPHTGLDGGPHGLALSRDGRRLYVTNAFRASWNAQFYHREIRGWMGKVNVNPCGGMRVDPDFFVAFEHGALPTHLRLLTER